MPLISPETSSPSSRDGEVLIMSSSGTIYRHHPSEDLAEPIVEGEGATETWADQSPKDRIILLGPFGPRSIDLTSSDSDVSGPSYLRQSRFSPIPVPIPSYEDCFQAPAPDSSVFDPMEYESSVCGLDLVEEESDIVSCASEIGWSYHEHCDHLETVRHRLAVEDSLMSVDRISTPQQRPHLSAEISPAARLSSPPPENRPDDPLNGDVFLSTEITRTSGRRSKLNPEAPPYTIPQLRSLAICDDLPTAPDSRCHACHDTSDARAMKRVLPCHDVICRRCFSAALGAVSEGHPVSRCPACLRAMTAFAKLEHRTRRRLSEAAPSRDRETNPQPAPSGPIVMRIDNVAWDLTPEVVEAFLPPCTLADTIVPIHIPLDRYDGRTKDYMYIEVASIEAARKILQKCQNAQMPGGPLTQGRKRAVTITQVHYTELLRELRPHSSSELRALLALCQASVSDIQLSTNHADQYIAPNGIAHFVKNRHGPFNALMSILSKVKGKESPTYWDLFCAIAALASHIARMSDPAIEQREGALDPDRAVLERMTRMFEAAFGLKLDHGRLSPV